MPLDQTQYQHAMDLDTATDKPMPKVSAQLTGSNVGYDPQDDMFKIKSMQKKFRSDFTVPIGSQTKWDVVTGAGGSITTSGGQLVITSGTTVNSESYILSKDVFTIPFKLSIALTISQRIANHNLFVEAVSVDPITLQPDGKNTIAWWFDGTSATSAKYRVQNNGLTPLDSGASTVPTTASGSVYELEPFADEAWFHGNILDSVNARANSYRRHQQVPDPNQLYKIRIRSLNGSTAPASSTTINVQYVSCQDYAELTAEITAGRGQAAAGQAIGVMLSGGNLTGNQNVGGAAAHDGAVSGNPVRIAGKAINIVPTAVSTTGDTHDLITTMVGALIQKPYAIPEADFSWAAPSAIAVTTDNVVKAAGAAGIRNYVTGVQLQNTGATATEVVIKDGATVIWRGFLPASMPGIADVNFATPLKGSAATALNFACITAGANVYANVQGYQAP